MLVKGLIHCRSRKSLESANIVYTLLHSCNRIFLNDFNPHLSFEIRLFISPTVEWRNTLPFSYPNSPRATGPNNFPAYLSWPSAHWRERLDKILFTFLNWCDDLLIGQNKTARSAQGMWSIIASHMISIYRIIHIAKLSNWSESWTKGLVTTRSRLHSLHTSGSLVQILHIQWAQ